MPILPADLLNLIVAFAPLFTKPVFEHLKLLLIGALLANGKRTITACLRMLGLSQQKNFQNYHRVLNRAKWSAVKASKILLTLVVRLVPASSPIVIGADDTIERRRGKKINAIGYYRDPVASTHNRVVNCSGLKWLSLMVIVSLPFSSRAWALPFLSALCRPRKQGQRPKLWHTRRHKSPPAKHSLAGSEGKKEAIEERSLPRQHKSAIDELMILIRLVHRWMPRRLKVLVVDGAYAAVKLARVCAQEANLALVTRLRWDAALYNRPAPQPKGKPGPKPLKGARQRRLRQWAARSDTAWQEVEVTWYGGEKKKLLVFSRTALWHTEAEVPVEIRFVITRDPQAKRGDAVLATTKLDAAPAQIVEWFVQRWSVEVTFEEGRQHLGMETQRQWSDLAIARTTPCLLGLFSIVVLMTLRLQADGKVELQTTAWYKKREATFSDCLALVRKHLWRSFDYTDSACEAEMVYFPVQAWEHWLSCLAAAA